MIFDQEIILENQVARLVPLQEEHKNDLLLIALKHPQLLKYSPQAFGSQEDLYAYISRAVGLREKKEKYPFAIYSKKLKSYVGSTSFMNISDDNKRLEIGSTWISPEVQGSGINKNMKFLMLSYAFDALGYNRVELKSDSRNLQSRRAMEKIGAIYEGRLRSHTLMTDGFMRDTVYYSILAHEWQTIKATIFKGVSG